MESIYLFSLIGLLIPYSVALQVTPNSPCATFCLDSEGGDVSDPNSSTTTTEDTTCYDSEYKSTSAGRKFQTCMSCLQDSTFSQGTENDQAWFLCKGVLFLIRALVSSNALLDNLRYTFDNCVFGFPNTTGIPSSPCSTSTACGSLESALTQGDLSPSNPDYGYCDVDGGVMTSSSVTTCMSCVGASDDQGVLVNCKLQYPNPTPTFVDLLMRTIALVALKAGCDQRPAAGTVIGLSDTVFSETRIHAVNPTSKESEAQTALPITTIVGIAVGALVAVLAVAGFFFVWGRKRRNRRLRLEGGGGKGAGSRPGRHRRTSSLSFRCQTHLTPRSPAFFSDQPDSAIEEKSYSGPHTALGSHPIAPTSPVSGTSRMSWQQQPLVSPFTRPRFAPRPLRNISTTAPTVPDNVHYSTSPKASQFSPRDETPNSTTSTISTAQLLPLRAYNPAEYGVSSPHLGSPAEGAYTSPVSGSTASPLLSRVWDRQNQDSMPPIWEAPQRQTVVNVRPNKAGGALERIGIPLSPGKKRLSNTGSPVESKEINTIFPGPPSPAARWRRS